MTDKKSLSKSKKEQLMDFVKKTLSGKKRLVVIGLLIILLGFAGFNIFAKKEKEPQLQTAPVERGMIISSVSASGRVLTVNIMSVNTKASGIVKKVYVKNGDKVKKGDKLLAIDLDLQGKQKHAQAWSSYLSAKNNFESAKATLYSLDSQMWAANQKFINDAVARGLEENDPTYIQQRDDWLAAEAKYKNQQAVISRMQAEVNSAWLTYQQTSPIITAPMDGVVTSLMYAEGMRIDSSNSSSTPVAVIKKPGRPIISVNLSEVDVSQVKPGQKATITLDSMPDKTFAGKVISVDRVGQINSGVTQYPAIIQLDSSSEQILPNMAVTANIVIARKDNVLLIPSGAIQSQGDQNYVNILVKGKLQSVPVETGLSSDTQTEIVSGLKEGDLVVLGSVSATKSRQNKQSPFGGNVNRMMRMAH